MKVIRAMELDYGFMIDTFYKVWGGIGVTLSLTALSLIIALPIAFYMAVIRIRGHKIRNTGITRFYISFVPGGPVGFADFAHVQSVCRASSILF